MTDIREQYEADVCRAIEPGDFVRTVKGAKWEGIVCDNSPYRVPPVSETDNGWRADVLAIHPAFRGSLHVYPLAQLEHAVAHDGAEMASCQGDSPAIANWRGWRSIDTAPEDCRVILATSGNWVGEAIMLRDEDTGEQVWTWVDGGKPLRHCCYGWMPLPEPLKSPVASDLRPGGFDGPMGAE